ncbi:ferritin family protein [Thermococcus sp.]|uniref:ferritin family protein n=1 Tax=Thermococcus sp. TaxID=35749 RepID=UPI00262CD62F|nr:ferritin family protein [Thermococcus sp.]
MRRVVELERKKAILYRAIEKLVPRDFKDDLRLLASHSERNARLLEKIRADVGNLRAIKDVETALSFLEKAIEDPDATVEDYYRLAIEAERASEALYRELSMKAKDERSRRLFRWLADISAEHAEILERHLEMWRFMQEQVEEDEIPEDLLEQWFEDIDL